MYKTIRTLILLHAFIFSGCGEPDDTSSDGSLPSEPAVCVPLELNVDAILTDLNGLSIDEFFEASHHQLMLTDPERITSDGLSAKFGVRDDKLTDISDLYIGRVFDLTSGILNLLKGYNRNELSQAEARSYDIYLWMLEDMVAGREFRYHHYPVSQMVSSVQNDLALFFRDIHPVTNRQNAEDYITRLTQVDDKLACLREQLALSRNAGVVPLRFMLEIAASNTRQIASSDARSSEFYTAFEQKLNAIADLDPAVKTDLLNRAADAIETSVLPGYGALTEAIEEIIPTAPEDGGVWRLPDGNRFYTYLLSHHTTLPIKAEEIHELGLSEVDRIRQEILDIAVSLDFPANVTLTSLFASVAEQSGFVPQNEIVSTYEAIIDHALQNLDEAFDIFPETDVIVIGGNYGGFYIAGSEDGSRPGAFYAYTGSDLPWYDMPSLTYHETVPGHHFQIAIAQGLGLPSFRKRARGLTGYTEGWALYVERLVKELGFYDDDAYGDLGRLQYELFRAVRLVVDTGMHTRQWTFNQAVDYLIENTGYSRSQAEGQIARYLAYPGQAVAYKIGMLKILELRELAESQLGETFDLKSFHRVILTAGRVPLTVLEEIVSQYIDSVSDSKAPTSGGPT